MSEEKDDNIKINIPLFTNLELEEFDFKLDNYLDSIVQEVSKAVLHDKENILLQKVIQKLQKELDNEKRKNKILKNLIVTIRRMSRGLVSKENGYFGPRKNFSKQDLYEQFYNIRCLLKGNYVFLDDETFIKELLEE